MEDALSAHTRKKREERNSRQEAETQKLFENLPEPPEDLGRQVLKVCSDAGFLWVTNDKQSVVDPGGVENKIPIQRARCDSCGGEYTLSELLKHKSTATCECCGEKITNIAQCTSVYVSPEHEIKAVPTGGGNVYRLGQYETAEIARAVLNDLYMHISTGCVYQMPNDQRALVLARGMSDERPEKFAGNGKKPVRRGGS